MCFDFSGSISDQSNKMGLPRAEETNGDGYKARESNATRISGTVLCCNIEAPWKSICGRHWFQSDIAHKQYRVRQHYLALLYYLRLLLHLEIHF